MPHAFLGWTSPTGDFRLPELGEQEQVSLLFLLITGDPFSLFTFFFSGFLPFIGTFKILATERELLDFYLNLPYQDPECVNTTLLSSPPAEQDSAFQSFMRLEFSVSTPEMVISLFKTIFFGREDPLLFIPAEDLDLLLRVALESVEFDQKALSEIFESLCKDRHESPSYSSVMESKADAFSQLLEQHRNDQLAKRRRNQEHAEVHRLQERIRELQKGRESLLRQIERLPR